jgi:hypothetical protein
MPKKKKKKKKKKKMMMMMMKKKKKMMMKKKKKNLNTKFSVGDRRANERISSIGAVAVRGGYPN